MTELEEIVVEETIVSTAKPAPVTRTRRQPQYSVIVEDDDLHTFAYVIDALSRICGHTVEEAYRLALEIDSKGRAAVWTGAMEVAELKRDQIIGFGTDIYASKPASFPLGCYIEPVA
ncbi:MULTISPECIES: ATP-dependent Clp protease adaptor ClpS [unclassified Schlesneria]|uniref:ATP-dependent Clp protease adaptor ClpS n=1 Tax=Schlesneria TaxID=656899 RepID=UPI002EE08E80